MLALARTMPRHEILGTALGRRTRGAAEKAERRIRNAPGQLAELEVTESEMGADFDCEDAYKCVETGNTLLN